jgi:hypothetical protein
MICDLGFGIWDLIIWNLGFEYLEFGTCMPTGKI